MAGIIAEDQCIPVIIPLKKSNRSRIIFHIPKMFISYFEGIQDKDLTDHPVGDDDSRILPATGYIGQTCSNPVSHHGKGLSVLYPQFVRRCLPKAKVQR